MVSNHTRTMSRRLVMLVWFIAFISSSSVVMGTKDETIIYATSQEEEEILRRELEWAESTLEGYKRVNGKIPLRSSIEASHVHTNQWKQDSIEHINSNGSGTKLRGTYSYI